MFSGWFAVSLDDKGRIAVPASFRQLLTKIEVSALYATPFPNDATPHLKIYPEPAFFELADRIEALEDRVESELLSQTIIERSARLDLDAQGRILLPSSVRDDVQLPVGRVVVAGQGKRFSIFEESRYQARRAPQESLEKALKTFKL